MTFCWIILDPLSTSQSYRFKSARNWQTTDTADPSVLLHGKWENYGISVHSRIHTGKAYKTLVKTVFIFFILCPKLMVLCEDTKLGAQKAPCQYAWGMCQEKVMEWPNNWSSDKNEVLLVSGEAAWGLRNHSVMEEVVLCLKEQFHGTKVVLKPGLILEDQFSFKHMGCNQKSTLIWHHGISQPDLNVHAIGNSCLPSSTHSYIDFACCQPRTFRLWGKSSLWDCGIILHFWMSASQTSRRSGNVLWEVEMFPSSGAGFFPHAQLSSLLSPELTWRAACSIADLLQLSE